MSKYSLIPGLESFMEDTEVNVEVAVGEPDEVAEEVVETSEAAEEAGAVTEEAEATEEQAEMIFAQFAELEHRYNHVKQYGVDRTFMRLFNSNGELERAFRIALPSCESFDATGDKHSPESKACMEGLGDALKRAWEFLKELCAKIGRFFGRIVDAIRVRFGNLDKQIGRLKDFLKDRVDDPEAVKDVDTKVASIQDIDNTYKELFKKISISGNGVKLTGYDDVDKAGEALENDMKDLRGKTASELPSKKKEATKEFNEKLKKGKDALKKLKTDCLEKIKADTALKDVQFSSLNGLLELAAMNSKQMAQFERVSNAIKTQVKNVEKEASAMAARREETAAGEGAYASALGKYQNFKLSVFNVVTSICSKIAMECIKTVSARARYSKKAGA